MRSLKVAGRVRGGGDLVGEGRHLLLRGRDAGRVRGGGRLLRRRRAVAVRRLDGRPLLRARTFRRRSLGGRPFGGGPLGGGLLLRVLRAGLGRRARSPSRRLGALASASASGSPCFVTLNPSSSSAPHPAAQALRPPDQERTALGTRVVGHRWMVDGEVAVRVSLAPVHQAEPRPPLDDLALLALRTGDTGRLRRVLLDVLAVRVPGSPRTARSDRTLQRAPSGQVSSSISGSGVPGRRGCGCTCSRRPPRRTGCTR